MSCPDLELLDLHARDELPAEQRAILMAHVSNCAACRDRLELVRENLNVARRVAGRPVDIPRFAGQTEASPLGISGDIAPTLPARHGRSASSAGVSTPAALPAFPGYAIVREVSRGGQGVVYQAIQQSTRRKVAIKVMREGHFADASERARFEREVQILGQLKHPNIVSIYDSGSVGGNAFYVMDYISGQPLDEYAEGMRDAGTAGWRDEVEQAGSRERGAEDRQSRLRSGRGGAKTRTDAILRLFSKICDAVHEAHLKGIIHRDLKPSNIRVDTNGEPHVLDFGLAKLTGAAELSQTPAMTMTGQFLGSLPWSSPEQAEGQPSKIDIRTDVYSLGVMIFQLLTGRFPYEVTGNMRDVLDRILHAEPTPPRAVVRSAAVQARRQAPDQSAGRQAQAGALPYGIDDEIETIVLKCLAKERERRYQSAGELARDIQRYLSGEPIEAKRNSTGYLLWKLAQRHTAATLAVLSLVVILLSTTFISVDSYRRYRTARADSETLRSSLQEKQRREIELTRGTKASLSRLAFENFLAVLNSGSHELARKMLETIVERRLGDPSLAPAVEFVLSDDAEADFMAHLPADARPLGWMAAAARQRRQGNQPEEVERLYRCIRIGGPHWAKELARNRLRELRLDSGPPENFVKDEPEAR